MEQPFFSDSILIGGYRYSVDMATVLSAPKEITSLDGMQRGVRYIGKGAFSGCEKLRVVNIPMTVIRIEDFAFQDCYNIQELNLPYDIEYISPLAFVSLRKDSHFFLQIPRVVFPKEEFIRYAQTIPQYVSEKNAGKYGLKDEMLEEVDGYDIIDGLPICINEHELYRVVILTAVEYSHCSGVNNDNYQRLEGHIERGILGIVLRYAKSFITEKELVDAVDYPIINNIDDSFSFVINHHCEWLV